MKLPLSITEGSLAQRAWLCQERLLSPRTLHLVDEQLFWEYRQMFRIEERIQAISDCFGRFMPLSSIVGNLIRERNSQFDRMINPVLRHPTRAVFFTAAAPK